LFGRIRPFQAPHLIPVAEVGIEDRLRNVTEISYVNYQKCMQFLYKNSREILARSFVVNSFNEPTSGPTILRHLPRPGKRSLAKVFYKRILLLQLRLGFLPRVLCLDNEVLRVLLWFFCDPALC
jgi:hypothetical protein